MFDDCTDDALEGLYLWYGSRDEACDDEAVCSAMLRVGETGEVSFDVRRDDVRREENGTWFVGTGGGGGGGGAA